MRVLLLLPTATYRAPDFAAAAAALERLGSLCAERGLLPPTVIGEMLPAPGGEPSISLRRPDGAEEIVAGGAFDHFAP